MRKPDNLPYTRVFYGGERANEAGRNAVDIYLYEGKAYWVNPETGEFEEATWTGYDSYDEFIASCTYNEEGLGFETSRSPSDLVEETPVEEKRGI